MLGRIGADHVGVWARTSRAAELRVFYGTSPDALNSLAGPVRTKLEDDYTGWVLLEGLDPATKYYYEATTVEKPLGVANRTGHFHTLPSAELVRDAETNPEGLFNFRFEFATGNNQNTGGGTSYGPRLPTYRTMLRELIREDEPSKVDFAILNGDWLYEEERDLPDRGAGSGRREFGIKAQIASAAHHEPRCPSVVGRLARTSKPALTSSARPSWP